jgi:hypothetical protein
MLRGTTQSLQTVSDLLELFLTFVDDFLNSHAQQPATTNPYDSPIEWEKERT